MQTLIMVPLQEEIALFRQACTAHGLATTDATVGRLVAIRVPDLGLTVVPGGLGKVQFAVQTQHVLDVSRTWDVVICAGAAGALVDGLAVGDVVVATETVEHDIHNRFGPPLLPRFSGAATMIESLRGVRQPRNAFTVHFGPIASGDEDVVAIERQAELRLRTGALAVAWEGTGGARACQFSAVPFVEIRGVTDGANNNAAADFRANLATAMRNVATVIVTWLRQRDGRGTRRANHALERTRHIAAAPLSLARVCRACRHAWG
jgi:adenosylhomocysteine nucleosidase